MGRTVIVPKGESCSSRKARYDSLFFIASILDCETIAIVRVVIDATSTLLKSAGVKTYVHHWILALLQSAGQDKVSLYPFLSDLGHLQYEGDEDRWQTRYRLMLYHLLNRHGAFLKMALGSVDVLHVSQHMHYCPANFRYTATVYDLTCWLLPETHTPENVRATQRYADEVLRNGAGLIAISESTKRDASRILGLPEDKIEVIYPGVADPFFHANESAQEDVRLRFGLNKPYVLCVGNIEPRKNVDLLLDAWELARAKLGGEFELIVAGPRGWCQPGTLARLTSPADGVRYLGYVSESDLPALTAAAAVFAFPSLYEGFGLPLAQAMAAGVPAITSNVSSLPEVVGDCGVLIDPRSSRELADALIRLLCSPTLRTDLGSRGKARARALFRWDTNAALSWDFFRTVAGS
jgi:glycosyltransferase involved in cell wall biosynthesis